MGFWPTSYTLEIPVPSPSASINVLEWLAELRETLTFTSLLKDTIKDRDPPYGERGEGEVWGKGIGAPMPPPCLPLCCSTGLPAHKLLEPCSVGFLCRCNYIGMTDQVFGHFIPPQPLSPSLGSGGGAESLSPLLTWLVLLATRPHL